MSRSLVRRIVVGVALLLVVQYGLVGLIGVVASEPWPAVVLPAFKAVYSASDAVEVVQPSVEVVRGDGSRTRLDVATFLAMLPRSHHDAFFRTVCRPASISGTDATERCQTPDGARWFVQRAATLAHETDVQAVDVVWSRLRYAPSTGLQTALPVDTLRVVPPA